jgi:Tol biopolymer transport system component
LALALLAALAASAGVTFPGRNGLIAFDARVGGHYQIFVMNPDGSGLRPITHGTADRTEPSISPDGRTIVFVQQNATRGEVRAMTTTGAHQRHLASGWCDWPSFSPNSKQVVFTCKNQVWVMNASGSHQRRLTRLGRTTRVWFPTYSPDGKTIVFVAQLFVSQSSPKGRCRILAMNADGSHLRRLAYTTGAGYFSDFPTLGISFSPDGKTIAYGAYTNKGVSFLRVMNSDGSDQRLLPRSYGFTFPCYSPDGRQILSLNSHSQICLASAAGTHWRRLTRVSGGVDWAPNWGPHVH